MRRALTGIKPKIAALALATGILLSLLPPHVTDAADFKGHQPQKITVSRDTVQIDVRAKFRGAVFITVEHEKFQMPLTQDEGTDNGVFFRQAAVSLHGADGETAFLFCDVVPEQALFPGRRNAASASLACDGSGPSKPQAFGSGNSANTGVAMTKDMFPKNGEHRYISLEVAYI
ncbi:MAG: hypothetical protein HND56_11405 [Pseudomonadota bacterium]|nr:hypothetical protein [Pseudomonadota bacterium]QKK06256.1 MAG: hypothetical protein HND56_11405 [Pseudomonadota bacterium]